MSFEMVRILRFEDSIRQVPPNKFGVYKSASLTTVRLREHRTANRLADEEINLHHSGAIQRFA